MTEGAEPEDRGAATWPQAFVAVYPDTPDEYSVGVHDLLVVGRECQGVPPSRQLLLDDEAVSRRHLEIRLDLEADCAYAYDISTNGTRLNGNRIERATEMRLRPGDRLTVGDVELEFRAERFDTEGTSSGRETVRRVATVELAMVAGDIIGYSTISQYTKEDALLKSADALYRHLHGVLDDHRGLLNHYAGDAFLAVWEADRDAEAIGRAVAFVVAAARAVHQLAPSLELRTPDDEPIRMGWGVELGPAAVSSLPGRHATVLGDATNVAFRLSQLAGREGRPEILVTERVHQQVRAGFPFGSPEDVMVKGRLGTERVYGLQADAP